jgi:serine protease Do
MRTLLAASICALVMGAATGCAPQTTAVSPSAELASHDGFVTGPTDLRKMTALVRATPPARLVRIFETVAAQVDNDDPDFAAFLRAQASGGFGSGFIVTRRRHGRVTSYVVTNRHVIEESQEAEVSFSDGTTFAHCPVVYIHPTADLAVIALPEGKSPFGYGLDVAPAKPSDRQAVVATGYPGLGGKPSFQITDGKISNSDFSDPEISHGARLLQHTAPIDPGSSGGPLTNEAGKLVGVNVALARGRQNVNFAVPAARVVEAIDGAIDLKEHEDDKAYLRSAATSACKRLAAELASSDSNGGATLDLISMDLVANEGPISFTFAASHVSPALRAKLKDLFTQSPVIAYRVALVQRVAMRAAAGGGVQVGDTCGDMNPTDATNITAASHVRMAIPTARGAMEVEFALDRGAYRVVGGDLLDVVRIQREEQREAVERTSARARKGHGS